MTDQRLIQIVYSRLARFMVNALLASLLMGCAVCFAPVFAHQQKEAYSTILFNSRSGMLEISHRFYVHDAEHALELATGESADLSSDEQSQQSFADYLLSHFAIKVQDQLIQLDVVGFEVEGKYFWVYQEVEQPLIVSALSVRMTALQEVWSTHTNHVNVQGKHGVRSARLNANHSFKEIILN